MSTNGFSVDLSALEQASIGVTNLDQAAQLAVSAISDSPGRLRPSGAGQQRGWLS